MRNKNSRWMLVLSLWLGATISFAQSGQITVSGLVKDPTNQTPLPYATVLLKTKADSVLVAGSITDEAGRYTFSGVKPGEYRLEASLLGYVTAREGLYVGQLTPFLEVPALMLAQEATFSILDPTEITARQDAVDSKMDKKTYAVEANISQSGGSVLQAMQNLPGVTVQDGKVQLRGSDKITVLIDGKQTALTGFGSQSGLDNIPASAIERIEIITNPSAKYDANGNAGIINIIYKQNKQEGFSGKAGLTGGLGSLWVRRENLPGIRPQYQFTPKVNPSLSLNYRKKKLNLFFQGDYLYTHTLNKNEFTTRTYADGTVIEQQLKRNRNTGFTTLKAGLDWNPDAHNSLTVSGLFGSEKIIDRGDEPFFSAGLANRLRLWQFLEDELKTTAAGTAAFRHTFALPGEVFNASFTYTFHRENEKYFFDNIMPTFTGKDAFKLISDEQVADLAMDYVRPLAHGRIEGGAKLRRRIIPTDMQFLPGLNSPLDSSAGGWATYRETIPAVYGTYIYENQQVEAELGLRVEYVGLQYDVNPGHPTYRSSGYDYFQPFPNVRMAWKINSHNRLTVFYNRRVDRPNEVDIRIFPKYDDAEIIKVGNPSLRPQFTQSIEAGYKGSWPKGSLYASAFYRMTEGTITRIASTVPGSTLIYAVFQNVNGSHSTGAEAVFAQDVTTWFSLNLNATVYRNVIDSFTVTNAYPVARTLHAGEQSVISGNVKLNGKFHLSKSLDAQLAAAWLAPDIIPQGTIGHRFSVDVGLKKTVQQGKGEWVVNATDLFNTLVTRREIVGDTFSYISTDYNETQVIRLGYNRKF